MCRLLRPNLIFLSVAFHIFCREAISMSNNLMRYTSDTNKWSDFKRAKCLFSKKAQCMPQKDLRKSPFTFLLYASGSRMSRAAASPLRGSVGLG